MEGQSPTRKKRRGSKLTDGATIGALLRRVKDTSSASGAARRGDHDHDVARAVARAHAARAELGCYYRRHAGDAVFHALLREWLAVNETAPAVWRVWQRTPKELWVRVLVFAAARDTVALALTWRAFNAMLTDHGRAPGVERRSFAGCLCASHAMVHGGGRRPKALNITPALGWPSPATLRDHVCPLLPGDAGSRRTGSRRPAAALCIKGAQRTWHCLCGALLGWQATTTYRHLDVLQRYEGTPVAAEPGRRPRKLYGGGVVEAIKYPPGGALYAPSRRRAFAVLSRPDGTEPPLILTVLERVRPSARAHAPWLLLAAVPLWCAGGGGGAGGGGDSTGRDGASTARRVVKLSTPRVRAVGRYTPHYLAALGAGAGAAAALVGADNYVQRVPLTGGSDGVPLVCSFRGAGKPPPTMRQAVQTLLAALWPSVEAADWDWEPGGVACLDRLRFKAQYLATAWAKAWCFVFCARHRPGGPASRGASVRAVLVRVDEHALTVAATTLPPPLGCGHDFAVRRVRFVTTGNKTIAFVTYKPCSDHEFHLVWRKVQNRVWMFTHVRGHGGTMWTCSGAVGAATTATSRPTLGIRVPLVFCAVRDHTAWVVNAGARQWVRVAVMEGNDWVCLRVTIVTVNVSLARGPYSSRVFNHVRFARGARRRDQKIATIFNPCGARELVLLSDTRVSRLALPEESHDVRRAWL